MSTKAIVKEADLRFRDDYVPVNAYESKTNSKFKKEKWNQLFSGGQALPQCHFNNQQEHVI